MFGTVAPHNHPRHHMVGGHIALALGGLGLRSASRGRQVSFWSSWADVLHMVRLRHPAVAETMLEGLNSDDPRHRGQSSHDLVCKTWGSVLLSGTFWPTVNVPWVPRS